MNILLVDDHRLVADALAIMLHDLADAVKVTICHTSQHALSVIDEKPEFDLILTDIYMPGIDGLGFLQGLKSRAINTPVVVISGTDNVKVAQAAIDKGAAGFINKSLPGAEMLSALRKVLAGEKYQSDNVESTSLYRLTNESVNQHVTADSLSARQLEVLQLIVAGNSNKQIAQVLQIRETTVKYHTRHLFRYLKVKNRTSCIREARQLGLIDSVPSDHP